MTEVLEYTNKRTNQSGYRGVSWYTRAGKWRANYKLDGKSIHLGLFDDVHDAGCAVSDYRLQNAPIISILDRRGREAKSRSIKAHKAALSSQDLRDIALKGHRSRKGLLSSNQSGYRGVSWNTKKKRWYVTVRIDGHRIRGGSYKDVHEAGRVAEGLRYEMA